MEFVDEEDDFAVRLCHFLQNRLQTFLKLSAEARSSHKRSHIEGNNSFCLQSFRNITLHNSLGNPFSDRSLADARITDQHRIVFCPAGEDLKHAADFIFTADNRIKFTFSRKFVKIAAEFFQRLILVFGVLIRYTLGTPHLAQSFVDGIFRDPLIEQQSGCTRCFLAAVVKQSEEQMFRAEVFIFQLSCFFLCRVEDLAGRLGEMLVSHPPAFDLRKFFDRLVDLDLQVVQISPDFLKKGDHDSVAVLDERGKKMFGLN